MQSLKTFTATIHCGMKVRDTGQIHYLETPYKICQDFVNETGECVSFRETQYIYTNGNEPGIVVEFIQYPRFPRSEDEIPNSDYFWQLQGYMHLTGIKKAKLAYCLMDAPDYLIEAEARKMSLSVGKFEVDMELYDQVYDSMTYKNIDKRLRYKCYDVDYDPEMIEIIKNRVIMCREYIYELMDKTPSILLATRVDSITIIS